MQAIIARLVIKAGEEETFEAAARDMMAQVANNEPGCKLYVCSKAKEPQTYVFMERYVDDAAMAAHREADHFKAFGAKIGGILAGAPQIERLSEI